MNTFKKDYFISVDRNKVIICSNPNNKLITLEDIEDITKRYLYKKEDLILTPFGIQTIKNIVYDYSTQHGHEWLITVEENGNQYKPCEIIGIVVRELPCKIMESILNNLPLYDNYHHHLDMQYYMEYCERNGYVTPQTWIEEFKHY